MSNIFGLTSTVGGAVSTSTGFDWKLYNTSDETTNYERLRVYWNTNIAKIMTELGGTGTIRDIRIGNENQNNYIQLQANGISAGNGQVLDVYASGTVRVRMGVTGTTLGAIWFNSGTDGFSYRIASDGSNNVFVNPAASQNFTIKYATTDFHVFNQNFVRLSGGIQFLTVNTYTTAQTLTTSNNVVFGDATTAAFTITLPAAASSTGVVYRVKKIDASANAVTLDGNGAETIDGAATFALTTQWQSVDIYCNGTAWFKLG